jgi:hypothetical protein
MLRSVRDRCNARSTCARTSWARARSASAPPELAELRSQRGRGLDDALALALHTVELCQRRFGTTVLVVVHGRDRRPLALGVRGPGFGGLGLCASLTPRSSRCAATAATSSRARTRSCSPPPAGTHRDDLRLEGDRSLVLGRRGALGHLAHPGERLVEAPCLLLTQRARAQVLAHALHRGLGVLGARASLLDLLASLQQLGLQAHLLRAAAGSPSVCETSSTCPRRSAPGADSLTASRRRAPGWRRRPRSGAAATGTSRATGGPAHAT